MKRETRLARRFARRALELLENTEYLQYRSRAHQLMAFTELDAGNADAALEYIRRGRELAVQSGTGYDEAKFAIEEARALAQLGRFEEAATAAINASAGLGGAHPWDIARSHVELAGILEQVGQPERALELYELAIEGLESSPNRYLADAYTACGELLERLGRQDDAYATFKKAARLNSRLHQLAGH